mmetsp:Transcript_5905/g.5144  ORF Transcript_5905/g.5144 Transcript_5905/m.5144 type:complete len:98 (-) Transcript_5905:1329-1622(-)
MKSNAVFAKHFGNKFLSTVAMRLQESIFAPDEIIFSERDHSNNSIYFIAKGKVKMLIERFDLDIKSFDKGDFFGEISFFTDRPRVATAATLTFCSIV